VVAMAAMLTLLPAVLLACGRWVFWPANPAYGSEDHTTEGVWARVGELVAKGPRLVWVGTTIVLLALSTAFFGLEADGLSAEESFIHTPDSVKGDAVVARNFDAGSGVSVFVVTKEDKLAEVTAAVADTRGIIAESVTPFAAAKDGVVPIAATQSAASDTKAARDTIERLREAVHDVDGADALVGGQTAILLDTIDASSRDNKVIIPIVLVVVLLVLCVLLRAIVAPVVLLLTVVLSFGAAMGISTLLFEHVFGFAGADASFPLFVFVFLVALGIDYNIFLMTRVHEESARVGTRQGALVGLRATGGVITSAGLVLAGTFAALGTLPLVFAAELGVAVALGVLLDTFIVRSVLVTALTLDLGRVMWWPSKLWLKRDEDLPPAAPEPEVALVDD
jgi:RND superfamily putative drug exporter